MARKATEQVTTISIDIGKNSLHLIGLEGCLGSWLCENPMPGHWDARLSRAAPA